MDRHDLDYLIRTVWGEARGEAPEGQQAVASVILNRAKQGGQGVRDVVTAPAQFTPWQDPRSRAELTSLRADSPEYQRIAANIQPALSGNDRTGGADHFYAPKLANPAWARGAEGQDIGNHRFLKLGYAGKAGAGGSVPTAAELLSNNAPDAAHVPHPDDHAAAGAMPSAADLLGGDGGAAPVPPTRTSQALGFQKGGVKPWDNAAVGLEWLVDKATGSKQPGRFSRLMGQPSAQDAVNSHAAYVAAQRQKGIVPGKLGEFAGNVVGTLPLGALPGGPITQGALSGAALSDAKDARGLAIDTAIGGATGKLADLAVGALGKGASALLSKSPKTMTLPELAAAKKAAYQSPALKGVTYTPQARNDLASAIETEMTNLRMNPKRHPGVASVVEDVVGDLRGKTPVTLEDLDNLRQIAWRDAAGLKDPNRAGEAMMGGKIVGLIDDFMDKADATKVVSGNPQAAADAMRTARDLNTRWRKALTVTNELDSADLRKSAAYSGANTDNAIRQRLRPLVDPTSGKRIRNATPDETAALRRVVEGTTLQNVSRLTGQGLDPRKLLGKLAGLGALGGAIPSSGASLVGPALGLVGTTVSNRASQMNVEELLRLIAAGGSKQALKKVATPASRAALTAAAKARPAAGLIGATAAAQFGGL